MATRTMEARAVISAVDRTGGVLAGVSGKFRHLANTARQVNGTLARVSTTSRMVSAAQAGVHRSSTAMVASVGRFLAPAAVGYAATQSVRRFAEVERRLTRVGITADASREEMRAVRKEAQELSDEVAMPFDKIVGGYEALAAQGRSLREIRTFMPSVARAAQAAGAEVEDIANAAGAVGDQMKIAGDRMQTAFDIMIEGGNAGKFELRDMARYLPSLAPLAASIGMAGEEGLRRLVATAQVVRNQTGTAEEAAASLQNIFGKMETDETVKRFKEFGIDLRKEMARARREGKDLLSVFVRLSDQALKGDLSKVPQLFGDMEFARGMRALLSQKGAVDQLVESLRKADGSTLRALGVVLEDTEAKTTRLSNAWDKFTTEGGQALTNLGAARALEEMAKNFRFLNDEIDRFNAGERTNWEKVGNALKNWVVTGQAVDQPAEVLAAARAELVDRDQMMRQQELAREAAEHARGQLRRFDELDALPVGSPRREFGAAARATERERLQAIVRRSEELDAAIAARDETNMQLTEVVGRQRRIAGLGITQRPEPGAPGLRDEFGAPFGFGRGGSRGMLTPWDVVPPSPTPPPAQPVPTAAAASPVQPTPTAAETAAAVKAALDADPILKTLMPEKIEAVVSQPVDVTGKVGAVVEQPVPVDVAGKVGATVEQPVPVDVTGKLDPVELRGAATVNVRVVVDGPGRVAETNVTSTGHIKASVGRSMPDASIKAGPR